MNFSFRMSAIQGVILRHLFAWRRDMDRIVDSFWWPLLDIVFWGITSVYLDQTNATASSLVRFFLGGIIFWYFVVQSQRDVTMPLLDEAWNRNLVNVFTTPLRIVDFVFAVLSLGMIKLVATMVAVLAVSAVFYQFNIFSFGWFLVPAVANLIFVGWWLGFIINGLILRFGYRVQAFAWALCYTIYPFSLVLYPSSSLPQWARYISSVLPTSYIFDSMRSMLYTGKFFVESLAIATLLNVLYIFLSGVFLQRMYADARKNARLIQLN